MNTAKHTSTQFSPYYTNFGQHMYTSANDYTNTLNDELNQRSEGRFSNIRCLVKQNLEKAYANSKKRYNLRT